MELKYGDAKATASVLNAEGKLKLRHTTWRGDVVSEVLSAMHCDHIVEEGGRITIEIQIDSIASP